MTTNIENNELIEILKGNQVINFETFVDNKYSECNNFKKQFRRDWDANHEKIEKKMEEKAKALEALKEEWLEIAFPNDRHIASNACQYNIQIVISKRGAAE